MTEGTTKKTKSSRSSGKLDISAVSRETLDVRVYQELLHNILSGRLLPGEKLPTEDTMATGYAVSRPVVRKALALLRFEGFIESRRGSGSVVVHADKMPQNRVYNTTRMLSQMLSVLEFRLAIEPVAAEMAARRRTAKDIENIRSAMQALAEAQELGNATLEYDRVFHLSIARASGNELFEKAIVDLWPQERGVNIAVRHALHFQKKDTARVVIEEHKTVLKHIEERRETEAKKTMYRHILEARERLLNTYKE